jgi:hypothetical protein
MQPLGKAIQYPPPLPEVDSETDSNLDDDRRTMTNKNGCSSLLTSMEKGVKVRREEPGNLDNGDLTHFFSGCDTISINLIDS